MILSYKGTVHVNIVHSTYIEKRCGPPEACILSRFYTVSFFVFQHRKTHVLRLKNSVPLTRTEIFGFKFRETSEVCFHFQKLHIDEKLLLKVINIILYLSKIISETLNHLF